MNDAFDSWKEVASKVESLGLKLKLHLEQETDAAVAERAEGETQNALDDLTKRMTDAFDAFGAAVKDDAVHTDVKDIGLLIRDAMTDTIRAVGAEVSKQVDSVTDVVTGGAETAVEAGEDAADEAGDADA